MRRSLGTVVLGWACGFLIAAALGASRAHNPQLAASCLVFAILGMGLLTLILVSIGLRDRAGRRREERESQLEESQHAASAAEAAAVSALADATAARIAVLEERLASEEQELEAAIEASEATSSAEAAVERTGIVDPDLREKVLETVVTLVDPANRRRPSDVVHDVERLLKDAS